MQEPKDASFNRDLETQSGRHKTFYTGYLNCHSLQFVCLFLSNQCKNQVLLVFGIERQVTCLRNLDSLPFDKCIDLA